MNFENFVYDYDTVPMEKFFNTQGLAEECNFGQHVLMLAWPAARSLIWT